VRGQGFVESEPKSAKGRRHNLLYRSFKKLLVGAGLPPMRFLDLRHSAAKLLLAMGTHPEVVQELLGHSQISLTLDTYAHVLPGLQGEAVGRLDALLTTRLGQVGVGTPLSGLR
jgi:integrase